MREKLREYVDEQLKDIPKTRNVLELKEELIGNMEERYRDLMADGFTPQDSYDCTINSMGDIRSLFEEERMGGVGTGENWNQEQREKRQERDKNRRRRGLLIAIGVGSYFLSFSILSVLQQIPALSRFDGAIFFLLMAIATGILIYAGYSYPAQTGEENAAAEEPREDENNFSHQMEKRKTCNHIIWLMATILFFVLIYTGHAGISWMIFLAAACITQIVRLLFFV